jgi:hypothetical protein
MTAEEIKNLLEEVFFEDKYKIVSGGYKGLTKFYVKAYSEKLKKHTVYITIANYSIGSTVCNDVWEMMWTLPTQNYYMNIPGTSIKRNPKDIGDPKAFLILSKEKLDDVLLISRLNNKLLSDMKEMDKNPIELIRDFKVNSILV